MTIRPPTEKEIREVLPAGARGWESQTGEFDYWFDPERDIDGTVPKELRGTFLRNGPGVTEVYGTPLKHPIDGDGMIARVTFTDNGVHFKNKFVQTISHMKEKEAGKMIFPGQMGSRPPVEYDSEGKKKKQSTHYRDPSHTNVFYWGGKVISCHEYSLPHSLCPKTLETVGRDTLGGTLDIRTLSAHYRYDADKDLIVLVAFKPGIELLKTKPQIRLYEFDRSWKLHKKTKVSVPGLNYAHDFILTPNWYVLHMTPFVNTSKKATMDIVKGKTSPGESLAYSPECPSKMVLVGRTSKNEGKIIELDTEPCHIYHFGTAYENPTDKSIQFDACCLPPGFTMEWQYKSFLANVADFPGTMHHYTVTFGSGGKASLVRNQIAKVSRYSCEFPFVNQYRHCVREGVAKPRYFYMMAGREGVALPFANIVKYDYETNLKTEWDSKGVIGEPVFIPRLGEASAHQGNEDDGWLIAQHYVPGEHRTQFIILDAACIERGPVCVLKLRHHLPISFHGTFSHNILMDMSDTPATDSSRL
eukprot:TRINITY_DN490_c3_g1_i1.p1 TRINITY_DN490_c3_g1~~TRINITY_DN490_c3_g1_i1.p1  ORF type:complete len:548 (+),score=73.66 TRINITY_DN490_c3_g1_i1:55-1644(+)